MAAQRDEGWMVAGGSNGGARSKSGGGAGAGDDVDGLIRDVASGRRNATGQEVARLRNHVATAPFSNQQVRAAADLRGLTYQGRMVRARDDTRFIHLVKRVLVEEEWALGTTFEEYLADLHSAVRNPDSHLTIYDRGQGPVAVAYGPNIIPTSRRGAQAEGNMVVIYAVNRHGIISGYQVNELSEVDIPESVQWLT